MFKIKKEIASTLFILTIIFVTFNNCSSLPLSKTSLVDNSFPKILINNKIINPEESITLYDPLNIFFLKGFSEETEFCLINYREKSFCDLKKLSSISPSWTYNKLQKSWSGVFFDLLSLNQPNLNLLIWDKKIRYKAKFNLLTLGDPYQFFLNGQHLERQINTYSKEKDFIFELVGVGKKASLCIRNDCYFLQDLNNNWIYSNTDDKWIGFYPRQTFTFGQYDLEIKNNENKPIYSSKLYVHY